MKHKIIKSGQILSIKDYHELAKAGRIGKAKQGDKAKAEMENIIKGFTDNYETEYQFSERKFKFDYAIPTKKIAIEYEGLMSEKSGHTTVTGYTSNCDKYNLAAILGWKVLRYTALNYKQLESDLAQLFGLTENKWNKEEIRKLFNAIN